MRTNQVVQALKESLEAAESKEHAWQIVNEGTNLNTILSNFTEFLPTNKLNIHKGQFLLDPQIIRRLNLFEIYAIISLQKPELITELLKKFSRPNQAYKTFTEQLFNFSMSNIMPPFEVAIILAQSNIATSTSSAFFSPDLVSSSWVKISLGRCQELYDSFNSQVPCINLPKEIYFHKLITNLPYAYHSRLLRLTYMTGNADLDYLYQNSPKASFLRFVPQLISFSSNLLPLTHQDEAIFLESMHYYFSLKTTCKSPPSSLVESVHISFINAKYQNTTFLQLMEKVYSSLISCASSNNSLDFCKHYLTSNNNSKRSLDDGEQSPAKKLRSGPHNMDLC